MISMICIIIIDSDFIIMYIALINTIQYSLRWKNIFYLFNHLNSAKDFNPFMHTLIFHFLSSFAVTNIKIETQIFNIKT